MNDQERIAEIARLNDHCRKAMGVGNNVLVQTCGISALPIADQSAIREMVEKFDDFKESNDPWGERDFGTVYHSGDKIFWKIDYFDSGLEYGSEDAADPRITKRVLTVMLAEEY